MNNTVKTFFRKPIVAMTSAVIFLTVAVRTVLSFTGIYGDKFFDDFYEDGLFLELLKSIDLFGLFLATALLMFFIQSRKENGNLKFAAAFFRTGSIIGLVFIIVALVLCMAFMSLLALAIFFSIGLFFIRFLPMAVLSAGFISVLFTVFLSICIIVLLLAISQLLFAGSVRKAVRGDKIRRGTAMFFAVVNFTLEAVFLLLALGILIIDRGEQTIPLILYLLLNIFPYVFVGITALSYFINIKKHP